MESIANVSMYPFGDLIRMNTHCLSELEFDTGTPVCSKKQRKKMTKVNSTSKKGVLTMLTEKNKYCTVLKYNHVCTDRVTYHHF